MSQTRAVSPAGLLQGVRKPLTAAQRQMAELILREFTAAGLPTATAMAAVVNAWAESRFKPDVKSGFVGEDSVGLFQLNAAPGAAGEGMSFAERADPLINTRRIIEVTKEQGNWFYAPPNARVATAMFTERVERPANARREGQRRADEVADFFPGMAKTPAGNLPEIKLTLGDRASNLVPTTALRASARVPWWGKLAIAGGIAGAVWYVSTRR